MADFMENLNERQREAVLETEGYVRVIAGAGSGKTKLLVSRYAYLVQDYGIDSSNILCVTFTNKAAGEMKKRIRGLIGENNDVSLICTYHGFCNRLLRENPEKLFLNKQFQIIDAGQQKAILGEIYQKLELKLDYATFEAILRKIGRAKKDMKYVTRICNPRPCQILDEIKNQDDRIIEDYLQRQKATYSLDFHDLIAFAIYLLETDSEVREKWQERLNYIMVDEFQDSSRVEMRLVELLSGMYRNLMIVGDPDQNIYEWRGSDVKLLVDFDKEHEPTKTIILNQNYRSTPQILQCANTLIEKNELRLKKDLFTRNPAGAPVVHYHSRDDFEEMDQVIANIKKLQEKEGLRYSDFAIVYRAGFLSRVAEKKLAEKNIPYEIFGGVRFYERMEIQDILAYLKLIAYDDDGAFRRIVNTPRRRFGRAKMNLLERLREQEQWAYGNRNAPTYEDRNVPDYGAGRIRKNEAEGQTYGAQYGQANDERYGQAYRTEAAWNEGRVSLFETLSGHLEHREFQGSDVEAFVRFVQSMRRSYREKRISDIVNQVTSETGYESYIRELGDEERLDNLAEFKQIANEFEREFGENISLEGFLQQIALQSGEDSDEARDAVKLMTIHSAKGLEFPAVFILGFTEGVFPSAKTIGDRKKLGLEEERRLCYVAITRAEKYLFLMESEGTSSNGMKKLVSRFLEEIGENNYVRIGRISEELKRESRGYTARLNRDMLSEPVDESLAAGDTVEHHVFGRGTILSIDEKRGSYSIQFEKLKLPRNISSGYFRKKHVDLRQAFGDEKAEENGKPAAAENGAAESEEEAGRKLAEDSATESAEEAERKPIEDSAAEKTEETERKTAVANNIIPGQTDAERRAAAQAINQFESLERYSEESEKQSGTDRNKTDRGGESVWGEEPESEWESGGIAEPGTDMESDQREEEDDEDEWEFGEIAEPETDMESDWGEESDDRWEPGGTAEPEKRQILREEPETEESGMSGEEEAWDSEFPEVENVSPAKPKADFPNLWKREDVPHSGWHCVGVEDLGAPVGICQMCGYQIIRYAHQMEHPEYGPLSVGCVCAGRMEGDVETAKRREAEFKNKQSRRLRFFQRKWKQSKKGNEYLKIDGHVIVLYQHSKNTQANHDAREGKSREGASVWKYAIDNQFCRTVYATRERAVAGVFDALDELRKK